MKYIMLYIHKIRCIPKIRCLPKIINHSSSPKVNYSVELLCSPPNLKDVALASRYVNYNAFTLKLL